jgi:UDP-N-acetyl-D-mannosaminuronic acid dehydrogenase
MPEALHLKPQEIDTVEKRGKYTVAIVGCGQKGILYGTAFAEAGFKVVCTDADQSVVKRLSKGKTPFSERDVEFSLKNFMRTGMFGATSDLKTAIAQSDIVMLTISVKIDEKKNSDYSEIENYGKQIGTALKRGALVVYGSVSGFGFMEGILKETLENASGLKAGEDFGLAYNPILISEENYPMETLSDQELRVAANDKTSRDAASAVLGTITKKGVKQVSNFQTAELATLFVAARWEANVALTNELAVICENIGMDYYETLELLQPEMLASSFAPTIAEEVRRNEAYLLMESAENLSAHLRLPAVARQINESMVKHAVDLIHGTLRSCGKTVRRARVTVLGLARPGTAGDAFVKALEAKGAKVNLYDPLSSKKEAVDVTRVPVNTLSQATEGSDCIIILTGQEQFKRLNLKKLRAAMRTPAVIVDLAGKLDPQKIEKEGFIYSGLGRGTGKK